MHKAGGGVPGPSLFPGSTLFLICFPPQNWKHPLLSTGRRSDKYFMSAPWKKMRLFSRTSLAGVEGSSRPRRGGHPASQGQAKQPGAALPAPVRFEIQSGFCGSPPPPPPPNWPSRGAGAAEAAAAQAGEKGRGWGAGNSKLALRTRSMGV